MTTVKKTTPKLTLAGTVTKVELKRFDSREYGYGRELYDLKLMLSIRTDDGRDFWFYTPATRFSVNSSGPYSIALVNADDWITHERWDCEGFAGARGLGHTPVSRVKVGDRIEVSGKVKAETRYGTMLWYVKRLDYSFAKLEAAYMDRVRKATATVPTRLPATETPPTIPGVEWSHIGGWYGADETPEPGAVRSAEFEDRMYGSHYWTNWDSKITNYALLIGHVEGVAPETVIKPE